MAPREWARETEKQAEGRNVAPFSSQCKLRQGCSLQQSPSRAVDQVLVVVSMAGRDPFCFGRRTICCARAPHSTSLSLSLQNSLGFQKLSLSHTHPSTVLMEHLQYPHRSSGLRPIPCPRPSRSSRGGPSRAARRTKAPSTESCLLNTNQPTSARRNKCGLLGFVHSTMHINRDRRRAERVKENRAMMRNDRRTLSKNL